MGGCAVLAAALPASAAESDLNFGRPPFSPPAVDADPAQVSDLNFSRPPFTAPPVSSKPGPVLTVDFTVTTSVADPAVPLTINVPKFGPNDFSGYGYSGLGYNLLDYGLTKVEIQFTTFFSATIRGENDTAGTIQFTYELPLTSTFSYPNGGSAPVLATITSTGDSAINLLSYDGVVDWSGSSGYTGGDNANGSSSLIDVPQANLGSYSGSGNWTINVASLYGTFINNLSAGKSEYTVPLMWTQSHITYSYEAIPETRTILAAGSLVGLMALGQWRARRRSN